MKVGGSRASYHVSPLRYPGGKAKLAPFFKNLLRSNKLLDSTYVEPFAGGGGVGLCLLLHGYVDKIFLNDLSVPIFAFWNAMLNEPERFKKRILDIELSTAEWFRQKQIFLNSSDEVSFELGFATFYLNRTNHSGVLNGGMIGGKSQKSNYRLDARFNRSELSARVDRISRVRSRICLLNLDAKEVIANVKEISRKKNPVLYVDPPYFKKGRDLYYDFYKPEDHKNLRDSIKELDGEVYWVVSYDSDPEILNLYSDYLKYEYKLAYSVTNGRTGKEVMYFSGSLKNIPLDIGLLEFDKDLSIAS